MVKVLYDGTEVSDDTPTKATSAGRVLLTQNEVAARDAENASTLALQIAEAPNRLRKKHEFLPVTVGGVTITPIDKTLTRLYAVIVGGNGVTGWRADNGVFDLTHAEALALYNAGQDSIAKAFAAQAAIEGNTYETLAEVEVAYDTAYNQA